MPIIQETPHLIKFFQQYNNNRELQIGFCIKQSTHNKYVLTLSRLKEFVKNSYNVADIPLDKVRLSFILNFESFLKMQYGLSNNSTERLIKIFKRIVLIAKEEGLINHNPFVHHKSKQNIPLRVYLNTSELRSIITTQFDSFRLEKVKDLFLFCCFTGLSYSDLVCLSKENIIVGCDGAKWICINRVKTGTESRIKLLDLPLRILEKYKNKTSLLPTISNAKFNLYLREIKEYCGIDKRITVHTARHTFSTTIALSNGLPIETLSRMLGHSTIRATQVYAKILDTKVSEDVCILNSKITDLQNDYS